MRTDLRYALAGATWGALGWLLKEASLADWIPGAMGSTGSWLRAAPLVQALEGLLLLPMEVAGRAWAIFATVPSLDRGEFALSRLLWVLAVPAGAHAVWLIASLWSAAGPRRWMVGLLTAALVIPYVHRVYVSAAAMSRLFPAGTYFHHVEQFSGAGRLRYTDLAPAVRGAISYEEFSAWRTWEDVVASFRKAPKVSGPAYTFGTFHMDPVDGKDGESWGTFTFDRYSGKLMNVVITRVTPEVYVTQAQTSPGNVGLRIKNTWNRPITVLSLSATSETFVLGRRLSPGEETMLAIPREKQRAVLTSETTVRWSVDAEERTTVIPQRTPPTQ